MRRRIRGPFAALLCLTLAGASQPSGVPLKLSPDSRLWFDGKSTVRDWSCKATVIDAALEAEGNASIADVLKGQRAVKSVTLTFPTAKLDCANGTMNGHMLKALNASQHPDITFVLSGYELGTSAPLTGTVEGTLTINGVPKSIVMSAQFGSATGGALRVTGAYPLKMTDWQVVPPRLMMGALKVNEMITVNFDLQLQP